MTEKSTHKMGGLLAELFSEDGEGTAPGGGVSNGYGYTRELPTIEGFITSPSYLAQSPLSTRQLNALKAMVGDDPERVILRHEFAP
jgi:hypothetical protein